MNKICPKHGRTIHYKRKDCGGYRCGKCAYEAVKKRRYKLKAELIRAAGGRCSQCGYNKSTRALGFHHRNPNEKDFGFKNINAKSLEDLLAEADKCDLLCANCHMEVHEELEQKPHSTTVSASD